jgi:hypothetical protein
MSLDHLRAQIDALVEDQEDARARQGAESQSRKLAAKQMRDWERQLKWASLKLKEESDPASKIALRKKIADLKSRLVVQEVEAKKRKRESEAGLGGGVPALQSGLDAAKKLRQSATSFHDSYIVAMKFVAALAAPSASQSVEEARREARASVRIAREYGQTVDQDLRSLFGHHSRKRP